MDDSVTTDANSFNLIDTLKDILGDKSVTLNTYSDSPTKTADISNTSLNSTLATPVTEEAQPAETPNTTVVDNTLSQVQESGKNNTSTYKQQEVTVEPVQQTYNEQVKSPSEQIANTPNEKSTFNQPQVVNTPANVIPAQASVVASNIENTPAAENTHTGQPVQNTVNIFPKNIEKSTNDNKPSDLVSVASVPTPVIQTEPIINKIVNTKTNSETPTSKNVTIQQLTPSSNIVSEDVTYNKNKQIDIGSIYSNRNTETVTTEEIPTSSKRITNLSQEQPINTAEYEAVLPSNVENYTTEAEKSVSVNTNSDTLLTEIAKNTETTNTLVKELTQAIYTLAKSSPGTTPAVPPQMNVSPPRVTQGGESTVPEAIKAMYTGMIPNIRSKFA